MPTKDMEGQVITENTEKVKEPDFYKVLLHNDDYSSMEFVVLVLESVFHKNNQEANQIMLNVHNQGIGVAGIFPYEIAETKVALVHDLAKRNEFPLRCSIEKA